MVGGKLYGGLEADFTSLTTISFYDPKVRELRGVKAGPSGGWKTHG